MKRIKVKPSRPDLVVLDDLNRRIPADGAEVNRTALIGRLIKEGSLIVSVERKAAEHGRSK